MTSQLATLLSQSMGLCLPKLKGHAMDETTETPRTRRNFLRRRPAKRGRPNLSSIPEVSTGSEPSDNAVINGSIRRRRASAESFPQRASIDMPLARTNSSDSSIDQRTMLLAEMQSCSRIFSRRQSTEQEKTLFLDFDDAMSDVEHDPRQSPFSPRPSIVQSQVDFSPRFNTRDPIAQRLGQIETQIADLKFEDERRWEAHSNQLASYAEDIKLLRRLVNKVCQNYDVLDAALRLTQSQLIELRDKPDAIVQSEQVSRDVDAKEEKDCHKAGQS